MFFFLILCITLTFSTSCKKNSPIKSTIKPQGSKIISVGLDKFLDIPTDTIYLSEFCNKTHYIKLQTSDNCIISRISKIAMDDSLLFIFEKDNRLLVFDYTGRFVSQIGTFGENKNEYKCLKYFELDKINNHILLYDDEKHRLQIYNYQSQLIENISLKKRYFHYFIPFYGDDILAYTFKPFTDFNNGYNLAIMTRKGNMKEQLLKRKETFNAKEIIPVGINSLYLYNDTVSLWQFHYDTIYRILPNGNLIPKFAFDFGTYRMPMKYRNGKTFKDNPDRYPTIRSMIETTNDFFLTVIYQREIIPLIINKKNLQVRRVDGNVIINDINDSIQIWPHGALSESTLYIPINKLELDVYSRNRKSNFNIKSMDIETQSLLLKNPWILIMDLN